MNLNSDIKVITSFEFFIIKVIISNFINISDVYSLASMHNLTGSNYLRTTLNFRPYLDKDLTMSLFFENSHYEFTSSEPRNNVRFQIGKRF